MSRLKIKRPKKWRRDLDASYGKLMKETATGAEFHMCVVPADRMDGLLEAGDRGDKHARRIVYSISEWFKLAQKAAADNHWPQCCSCAVELHRGEVCGYVVFLVPEGEERTGMIGCFCEDCLRLGQDAIADNTIKLLQEHGQVMSVH